MDKEGKFILYVVGMLLSTVVAILVISGYSLHLEDQIIADLIKNGTPPAEAKLAIGK